MQQWLNWIVPPFIAAIFASLWGVNRMYSGYQELTKRFAEHEAADKENFAHVATNFEKMNDRLNKQDVALATISANTEYIKRAIDQQQLRP